MYTTTSKSTDKLIALTEAVKHLPASAFEKIKKFAIVWKRVDDLVVPEVMIEYYE